MISRTVEYALRAVVHLADRAPESRSTDQIAEATRVPKAYLSKVLQNLGRAGVVRSRRGIGGGTTLLIYAIYRQDPVFILGQGAGLVIYLRNLYLIRRKQRRLAEAGA